MHDHRSRTPVRGNSARARAISRRPVTLANLLATSLLGVTLLAAIAPLAVPSPLRAQQRGGGAGGDEDGPAELNAGLLSSFRWRSIGPATASGRIADIAVDPTDRSTWYVAASSGNVWKTTNAGTTWTPIFDNYGSYSIGAIALDPNDHLTLWVGTGENNGQRSVGYGDGVYKSVDGGRSFTNMGLETSRHIGMIAVHPDDSRTVFVAAQGPLWAEGGERGLYRTTTAATRGSACSRSTSTPASTRSTSTRATRT